MTPQKIIDGKGGLPSNTWKGVEGLKNALSNRRYTNFRGPIRYMFAEVAAYKGVIPENLSFDNLDIWLAQEQTGGNIPFGLIVRQGKGVRITNSVLRGFRMAPVPGKYTNGDCIDLEPGAIDTYMADLTLIDPSDGGIDSKGQNDMVERVTVEGGYRAFRCWGYGQHFDTTVRAPKNAGYWFGLDHAYSGDWTLTRPNFTQMGKAPTLRVDGAKKGRIITVVDAMIDGVTVRDEKDLAPVVAPAGKGITFDVRVSPPADVVDFVLPTKLRDNDGNGFIELGDANRKKYNARVLHYVGPVPGGFGYNKVK